MTQSWSLHVHNQKGVWSTVDLEHAYIFFTRLLWAILRLGKALQLSMSELTSEADFIAD